MTALKDGRGAFVDALIGELARRGGCSHTVTFDRAAARLPTLTAL
jgi:predicted nucleic-acid-binding protein